MTLPVRPAPTGSVDGFEVHGLTRTEAMRFTTGFTAEALPGVPLEERADRAEAYAIACGARVSEAEAQEWRTVTDSDFVDKVVNEITALSGLTKRDEEEPTDPKLPSSGSS